MLFDIASNQPNPSLLDVDRFYIPDPWDDISQKPEETPAIVNSIPNSAASIPEAWIYQLAPTPVPNSTTIVQKIDPLLQDSSDVVLKADDNVKSSG